MISELVFEVTQEADGGYCAECLTAEIFTQGDSWDGLRANVREAVQGYFFDGPVPDRIRLHLVRDEMLAIRRGCADLSGESLVARLCGAWGYRRVRQEGSHIIRKAVISYRDGGTLATADRRAGPFHAANRTLNSILRAVSRHKDVSREEILKTL